jgi:hypothetical protein
LGLLTDVAVLDVSPWFPLSLHDRVGLLGEILDEHLCCEGDDEGGVVGAGANFVVGADDFFDACDW